LIDIRKAPHLSSGGILSRLGVSEESRAKGKYEIIINGKDWYFVLQEPGRDNKAALRSTILSVFEGYVGEINSFVVRYPYPDDWYEVELVVWDSVEDLLDRAVTGGRSSSPVFAWGPKYLKSFWRMIREFLPAKMYL